MSGAPLPVCVLAAVLLSGTAAGQGESAEWRFPTAPIGPQTVALGGAGVALLSDAEAARNPAGLLGAPRISVHHFEGYADYGGSVAAASVPVLDRVALGVSFRRFGWDRVIEDDLGSGTRDLGAGETRLMLTVAAAPARPVVLGVSLSRMVTDYLGSRTAATSASVGLLARYGSGGAVGIAMRDIGPAATSDGAGPTYHLPTRLRLGVTQRFTFPNGEASLVADVERSTERASLTELAAGASLRLARVLTLRAGYSAVENADVDGARTHTWSAGIGLAVGRLDLGFAFRFGNTAIGAGETFVGFDAFRPTTTH